MNFDSVTFKEKSRLRMVLSTLREMLKDRGYNVDEIERWPDASEIEKSCDYVKISMLISHSKKKRSILVLFPSDVRVGVASIQEIDACMQRENVESALVIVRESITPKAQQALIELTRSRTTDETEKLQVKKRIQVFTQMELVYNVTKHVDVPPHQLLSRADTDALLREYKCSLSDLPNLLVSDPIAKYYGLKRGNVCKITSRSETAISTIRYRVVV